MVISWTIIKIEKRTEIKVTPILEKWSQTFNGEADISIGVAPILTDGTAENTLPTAGTATALTTLLNTVRNCLKWLVARFDSSGNANTANKLAVPRVIDIYTEPSDTNGSVQTLSPTSFDGSAGISIPAYVPPATTTRAGAMTAAGKTKLDGIEEGANKYTLPTATATALGGIKVTAGNGLNNSSGTVSMSVATTGAAGAMTAVDKAWIDKMSPIYYICTGTNDDIALQILIDNFLTASDDKSTFVKIIGTPGVTTRHLYNEYKS